MSSDNLFGGRIRSIIPLLIGWYAWLARNEAKYEGKKIKADLMFRKLWLSYIFYTMGSPFEDKLGQGICKLQLCRM